MSTIDDRDLDRSLTTLFALPLDARDTARLDARMRAAILAPVPPRSWPIRGRQRVGLLSLALVALVGIAAGGIGLLERIAQEDPALGVAWGEGVRLGIADTSNGVTVVVERAYMDSQGIVISLRHDGYSYIGRADLAIDGITSSSSAAVGWPTSHGSASVLRRRTPSNAGASASMVLDVREVVDSWADDATVTTGDWHFEFSVPNAGGSAWRGLLEWEAGDVTTTLTALRVSPTVITGDLAFVGSPLEGTDDTWSADGVVIHDDITYPMAGGVGRDDRYTFQTDVGTTDWAGTWVVRVDRVYADTGQPGLTWLDGPWVFQVEVPE